MCVAMYFSSPWPGQWSAAAAMFPQCVPVCSLVPGDQARHGGPGSSNHITPSLGSSNHITPSLGLQHNQGAAQLTGLFNQKLVILLHIVELYFILLPFRTSYCWELIISAFHCSSKVTSLLCSRIHDLTWLEQKKFNQVVIIHNLSFIVCFDCSMFILICERQHNTKIET